MDQLDKILDIIDNPDKYTEEQIKEVLNDEESRKLYQTIVEVDGALAADEARCQKSLDIDQEWNRINRKTTRYGLVRKVAAIVSVVFIVGGIAFAAIQWGHNWIPINTDSQPSEPIAADTIRTSGREYVQETDTVIPVDSVRIVMPVLAETNDIVSQPPTRHQDSLLAVETTDICRRLQDFYKNIAQEKIYIQTDRPYYAAGDTVWFRAHVADALTNIPSTSPEYSSHRSRYVYVELHDNATNTLVVRHKVLQDSLGAFANAIHLNPDMQSGRYTMVAYTRWMQNFGEHNFAYQTLDIIGSQDHASKTDRHPSHKKDKSGKADHSHAQLLVRRNGPLAYITPQADDTTMMDSLSLVVYGGGTSFTIEHLDGRTLQLDTKDLPSGRNSIALMSGRTVLDEHVIVVDNEQATARVEMTQNGSQCKITVNARPGVYALSVCDGSIVRDDSLRQDIKSAMLSNGGLRLQDILSGQTKINYGFEREQIISGRVVGLFRKPKNAKLLMLCQNTGQVWHLELGNNQRFRISGLEYTDGTRFTFEATKANGGHMFIGLELDEEKYPAVKLNLPVLSGNVLTDDIVQKIRTRSNLDIWKTIELKEISISGRHLKALNPYGRTPWIGATHGDSILRQSKDMYTLLTRFGMKMRIMDTYYKVPTEYVAGQGDLVPDIYLNDMDVEKREIENIMNLSPSAIKQIEYFPSYLQANVMHPTRGALYIYVDWKVMERTMSNKPFVVIQPKGVMPPAVFPSQGGSTTLYWNPIVVVGEDGTAEVTFPVHPMVKEYNIHLEGISHKGDIITLGRD